LGEWARFSGPGTTGKRFTMPNILPIRDKSVPFPKFEKEPQATDAKYFTQNEPSCIPPPEPRQEHFILIFIKYLFDLLIIVGNNYGNRNKL
jgi:hypothetical protein